MAVLRSASQSPIAISWQVECLQETVCEVLGAALKAKISNVSVAAEESKRGLFFSATRDSSELVLVKFLSLGVSKTQSPELWFYSHGSSLTAPCLEAMVTVDSPELIVLSKISKENLGLCAPAQSPDLSQLVKFGAHIERMHQSELRACAHRGSPAFLPFKRPDPSAIVYMSSVALDLLRYIQTDRVISASLEELDQFMGTGTSFIHGDIKPENFLWTNQKCLALLDWECSGLGDWRWDFSSIIGSILLRWVDDLNVGSMEESISDLRSDQQFSLCLQLVRSFVASYEGSRQRRLAGADVKIINSYLVLWFLSRGFSIVVQQNSIPSMALNLLVVARGFAAKPLKYV